MNNELLNKLNSYINMKVDYIAVDVELLKEIKDYIEELEMKLYGN